ncbi:hypothetical protein LXA43DRAFT_1093517 [Ganoderma leucocontextum]|nr:hypothetical protein LXA43DRAFT_1093517 [Ganoderma leucocontextum]
MFTKTTFVKCALVPLAAAAVLSNVASATPAPALQVRDNTPSTTSSGPWPKKTDCDCDWAWDKDHTPKITQPNKDTVWKVGDHQKVTWEKKWDDKKDGSSDGKDGKKWDDGKEGKDGKGKDWDDGKDGKKEGCKTRLFLRKGDDLPFLILAEGFDINAGSVDVTVPNVFDGSDYRVTLSIRDDKPELQSNSDKFKITKHDKDHKECKDGKDKDGKDCKDHKECKDGKDKDGKDCKDEGY